MKLFDVLLIVFALSVSFAHSTGYIDKFAIVKKDKIERQISSDNSNQTEMKENQKESQ
ncbi:MAG: hypothetical protein HRT44_13725 [Bdellovibrionales bacterium]|nr:hypothetical protein [Bdellovibrionales bacterium]NQZ20297.1 hypothetical protein [Bdellovibrionales bacterium]